MLKRFLAYWRAVRALVRGGLHYFFPRYSRARVSGLRTWFRLRTRLAMEMQSNPMRFMRRRVRLWIDTEAFPRIFALLKRARHTVFIQMFIWRDDDIGRAMAKALLEAADRGVRVEISKEAIGDVFELHRDFLATRHQSETLWQRFWTHPNIVIHYATNNDHAKVYIIDGSILLLTGMNISVENHAQFHDYLVELHGPDFVTKYLTGSELSPPGNGVELIMNSETRKEVRPVLTRLLESARTSIFIEHCFISDPDIIDLLVRKTHQGVRVTIIMPERTVLLHHFTNIESTSELLQNADPHNMRIFLYPQFFHGKIVLVDRRYVFVGSANLMQSSLDEMGEVNVLITKRSRSVIKLRDILRGDIMKSRLLESPSKFRWLIRWLAWLKL